MAQSQDDTRRRHRQIVVACAPLVDLLVELYPPTVPKLNATDREIGAYIGTRELVERLLHLRREANETAPGELPTVLGGTR